MPKVTVYGSRLSPFVEKVVRALHWKKLDYELVPMRGPGEMRRRSPVTRKMPAADVDGERLYDSTFILRRLDELAPEPRLYATGAEQAAAQRVLEDWADESLYWLRLALLAREPAATARMLLDDLDPPRLLRPVLGWAIGRQLRGRTRAQGFGRLPGEVLERELGIRLDDVAAMLAGGPFLVGDAVSAADLGVFVQLHFETRSAVPGGIEEAVRRRPVLREWKERVAGATSR